MLVVPLTAKINQQSKVMYRANRNRKLTLLAFAVLLVVQKVSVMDLCWSLVVPFCTYMYGSVIKTFLDILVAMLELTFCVV